MCVEVKNSRSVFLGKIGFTLIELLVVVLIIGILAAVAVPQYQKTIIRTRFANFKNMAKAFYKATQIYYVQNNDWPHSLDELDVVFAGENTAQLACKTNHDMFCCLLYPVKGNNSGQIVCGQNDYTLAYKIMFVTDDGTPMRPSYQCLEATDTSLCSVITKHVAIGTNEMMTPEGYKPVRYYSL